MLKGAVARRYAGAVFEIGAESGTIDTWRNDLQTIAEYFGNKRLQFILNEPKVPADRKEQIVSDLLATKVQPQALSLAMLLVERNLVDHAPAIATEFEKRYNDYKGQAVAQITTAIPLDDSLRTQVVGELQQLTGKRILLQERVDPSILGGAIARVGDTLIDGSLKRRFTLLRSQLARGGGEFGGQDGSMFADLFGPGDPGDLSNVGPAVSASNTPAPRATTNGAGSGNGGSGTSGNNNGNTNRNGNNKRRRR